MKVTPVVWDRTINLPFLVTVVASIGAASVWTAGVNNRLGRLEERTRGLPEMEMQLTRMDERGEASKSVLERLDRRMERMEQVAGR